jgi:mannose/fructose/N-acetylgalactosamine-specific phosphotransferase system component IID
MGAGGSSSSNTTSIATKASVEALAQNIMNCKGNTLVVQRFIVSGSYNVINNFKQVQNLKLSSSCTQDAKSMADLQQSVAAAIQQAASSQSVSVLGALGKSSSEVNLTIENEVRQKITQQTIQDIVNNTNAIQESIISGDHNIVSNFEQSQTMELLMNNCQSAISQLTSVQTVDTAAKQSSTATQTNFVSDIVSSIFSGLQGLGILWVIIIVVAMAVGGYIIVKGGPLAAFFGKSPNGQTQTQPTAR